MFFETSAKDQININELFVNSTRKFIETTKNDPNKFKTDRTIRNPRGITINEINERNREESCCGL